MTERYPYTIQEGDSNVALIHSPHSTVNITNMLGKSAEYRDMEERLSLAEDLFSRLGGDDAEKRLTTSEKIAQLKAQLETFKRDVMQLAETFRRIDVNTERLGRARELFDQGKFGAARAVFETELDQMRNEQTRLLDEQQKYEANILPKLKNNSEEFLVLALSTQTDYENPNRFEDTCGYFEESIKSFGNKENLRHYAFFLQTHNFLSNAHLYYHQILDDFEHDLFLWERGLILGNLGILHGKVPSSGHSGLKDLKGSLAIWRQLNDGASKDEHNWLWHIAQTLELLSAWYITNNDFDAAIVHEREAIDLWTELEAISPRARLLDIARARTNLGMAYERQDRFAESEAELNAALLICSQIQDSDILKAEVLLSRIHENHAHLHQQQHNDEQAGIEYSIALKLLRESVDANPFSYLSELAQTLYNLSNYHSDKRDYDEAVKHSEEAHDIYHRLNAINKNVFQADICRSHEQLGRLYTSTKEYEKAANYLEKALTGAKELVEVDSIRYSGDLGLTLLNMAELKQDQNDFPSSLNYFSEALALYEDLAQSNPKVYLRWLAMTQDKLGALYKETGDSQSSSAFLARAVDMYRQLSAENPDAYLPCVAYSLANLGNLHCDVVNDYEKAREYFAEAISILRPFAKRSTPVRQRISMGFANMGLSYKKEERFREAVQSYRQALEIVKELAKENTYHLAHVIDIRLQIAVAFLDSKAYTNSIVEAKKALADYENLDQDKPNAHLHDLIRVRCALARGYRAKDEKQLATFNYEQTLSLCRQARDIRYDDTHEGWMGEALYYLANQSIVKRDFSDAAEKLKEAAEIFHALAKTDYREHLRKLVTVNAQLAGAYSQMSPPDRRAIDCALVSGAFSTLIEGPTEELDDALNICAGVLRSFNLDSLEVERLLLEKLDEIKRKLSQ